MNPVKGHLTDDPFAYPYSGSMLYSRGTLEELMRSHAGMPKPTEPLRSRGPANANSLE